MVRNLILRSIQSRRRLTAKAPILRPVSLFPNSDFNSLLTLISTPKLAKLQQSQSTSSQDFLIMPYFQRFRSSSTSSSGSSNVVLVKSEEEFNDALNKVQGQFLPAIFYFTAAWCGPCRFIAPVVGELSEKYPHVTTYKIDIDEEAIQGTLSKLQVMSVPTLHFFKQGKKAAEIVGADVVRLKDLMEKLYKQD